MKAFVIDPFAREITEVSYEGDYTEIYKHIKADLFCTVTVSDLGDTLFLDDEGLFKSEQKFFQWVGYGQPLAGRALVLGTDEEGESRDCQLTLRDIENSVRWLTYIR